MYPPPYRVQITQDWFIKTYGDNYLIHSGFEIRCTKDGEILLACAGEDVPFLPTSVHTRGDLEDLIRLLKGSGSWIIK